MSVTGGIRYVVCTETGRMIEHVDAYLGYRRLESISACEKDYSSCIRIASPDYGLRRE